MNKKIKDAANNSTFFKSYRKRGFGLTLETLAGFKKNEAIEANFFQALKDNDSWD